jgi:outer membrane protein, multidrug efflux system
VSARLGRLAISATLLLGLSSCTLEPHYHRPPPPVPALPPEASAGGPEADALGWREFFPDEQLQDLIALSLANNRDLRVATLNVASAQAQYRIQRSNLFPAIDVTASEEVERVPAGVASLGGGGGATSGSGGVTVPAQPTGYVFRAYDVGIGFTNYELDLFGRLRSLDHVALQQYFSASETQRSAQITLIAEIASAYLAVLADETLLRITQDTLVSQDASYKLTQRLFDAGTTTELTLRQVETTLDTARANLALYRRQLAQDRDALQLLLGAPIPENIDFSAGLDRDRVVSELPEGIPSDVLIRRPDVLAAEHQLQAANAQIGAARAAFLPTISLTGNFGTESTQLSGLFKDHSQAWAFAPQISVPIFAGGANLGNLQASKVSRQTAVAQYEKAIQTAFREVADALVARGTLNDQLEAQQALVNASAKAYRLADMRFKGGVDSYLNALDAQRTLYSAQQELASVRLTRLQNLVTLYKALGGGMLEHSAPLRTT